jgi:hypothetical protein
MMTTEQTARNFYESPGLSLPYLFAIRENDLTAVYEKAGPLFKHSENLEARDVDQAMNEVARSLRIIEHAGSTFEIGTANNDVNSDEIMLHVSTYSSAISTNPGNGYEFAAQAVRYPKHKHLYIASFGNGSTSPLLPTDADYVKKTGRFTKEVNGKTRPIESLQNLQTALSKAGLAATNLIGTDSAGGNYARAMSLAMESGQLSHAFFSEASGFVNLSIGRMALSMLVKENLKNAKQNRAISNDPQKMDEKKVERFKEIYNKYAILLNRESLVEAKVSPKDTAGSWYTSLKALKRGPTNHSNPLVDDSNALIAKHPAAKLTYGVAEHDPLYKDSETGRKAAEQFLSSLVIEKAPVKVVLIPGMTHAYNTYFPSLYHAIKRDALEL